MSRIVSKLQRPDNDGWAVSEALAAGYYGPTLTAECIEQLAPVAPLPAPTGQESVV